MPRLGQHFLTDPSYLERVVDAAGIAVGDRVLEIGPGRGHLTHHLLERGAAVDAIELDRGLLDQLEREFANEPDLRLHQGDAAQIAWPDAHKLVANLPYEISSPTVERFLDSDMEVAVLTLQRAFAQRLAADPAEEEVSRLTVAAQLRCEPEIRFTIPKGAFDPPPQVRSACARLRPRQPPTTQAPDLMEEVLDHVFTQKRKMLRSSLADVDGARAALESLGLAKTRPGRVPIDTWPELADRIHEEQA
jgi:16S rRNA (adenine1518-N6/adenine1519-N6)-dimethyltransferase